VRAGGGRASSVGEIDADEIFSRSLHWMTKYTALSIRESNPRDEENARGEALDAFSSK
jgi:hypothetical protein